MERYELEGDLIVEEPRQEQVVRGEGEQIGKERSRKLQNSCEERLEDRPGKLPSV